MGRQTVGGLTADKTNEQKNSLSERGRSPQRGGQQGVRGAGFGGERLRKGLGNENGITF